LTHAEAIEPVIAITAYDRPQALARLLDSIAGADYPPNVRLFISLEGGADEDVARLAREFHSPGLDVVVIQREERLGLREHILACGDLALEFGAVIVLEDDLFVDRYFYRYAEAALRHYADEPAVAGVALYAYEFNQYAGLPFRPIGNGYSTYCMQVPCSSGQCWTASQWRQFRSWYAGANSQAVRETPGLPEDVKSWPESSWKKYFAAYVVRSNRYFVYPYQAYSTNCSDPGGTHVPHGSDLYQVGMASQTRPEPVFSFGPAVDRDVAYDAFMEPCGESVYRHLGVHREEVEIDTLGIKPIELLRRKPLALTCRPVGSFIRQYPRSFRPIEQNFAHPLDGGGKSVLSLAKSDSVAPGYSRDISEYSYFAGYDLSARGILRESLRSLPKMLRRRIERWIGQGE
jgi:hypothetical protein